MEGLKGEGAAAVMAARIAAVRTAYFLRVGIVVQIG